MDLRARSAWACIAHLPEIVLAAKAEDPLGPRADLLPKCPCLVVRTNLVVAFKNREPKPLGIEPEFIDQELPCVFDRVFFEIVAERKIPEHFKERMVPCRFPDLVKVVVLAARPDAFLRCHRAFVVPLLIAEEYVLELVHPRVRKKKRRVICRQKRRRVHDLVPVPLKIIEEFLPDLAACHKEKILAQARRPKTKMPGTPRMPGLIRSISTWRKCSFLPCEPLPRMSGEDFGETSRPRPARRHVLYGEPLAGR